MKKTYVFSINNTQKIIFSISSFLISLIICYAIAESIDNKLRIGRTWWTWVIFILLQTWLQNKLWNTKSEMKVTIYFPNIYKIIKSNNKLKNEKDIKSTINDRPKIDILNIVHYYKSKILANKAYKYLLFFVVLLMISYILFILVNNSKNLSQKSKDIEKNKPVTTKYSENIGEKIKSDKIDNETVKILLKEIDDYKFNYYEYIDPNNHLGYKFYSLFPSSLKFFSKNNNECNMGAELIDEKQNIFKYTVVINPAVIPEMTESEMDYELDRTSKAQIDDVFKEMGEESVIVTTGTKVYIGKQRAIYYEVKLKNFDDSPYKYSMLRAYTFYLKDGVGSIGFFIHSNNSQLQKDFEEYKIVFDKIVNNILLSKSN